MNEVNEMIIPIEEKEPVYFSPKRVSFYSDFASILSWIVLVGFVGQVIFAIINLQSQMSTQSLVLTALLKEPSFIPYLFVNMLIPVLTGLVFFAVLQAIGQGLNVLLELDLNNREAKSKTKS
jgi:hypothetical protein